MEETGVELDGVTRSYGSVQVINDFHMKVKRGSIYALLGPSGCGKTTLLKLILGRLDPDAGSVKVLGAPPHTPNHQIPGSRVGYAPQETALYMDISIAETFSFHATMHGLTKDEFKERKRWLMQFLELPSEKRIIAKLSGGQQRRVSLAVALLHNPDILILDEPTVGLDPLLRLRIWDHLRQIADTGVTIIITTHYIEEARQADNVGLMRHGRLLAEGNPEELMRQHQHNTLEDVFLDLCRNATKSKRASANEASDEVAITLIPPRESSKKKRSVRLSQPSSLPSVTQNHIQEDEKDEKSLLLAYDGRPPKQHKQNALLQISAIIRRKITQLIRNPLTLIFELLIPTVQILLFICCIGPDPKDLKFAVVNHDTGFIFPLNGKFVNLGNHIVTHLEQGGDLKILQENSLDAANEIVKQGKAWGTMYIPSGFSSNLLARFTHPNDSHIQDESTIYLYLDLSNYQVALVMRNKIQSAFEETGKDLFNTSVTPIQIVHPAIYGSPDSKFSSFLAPGMITTISFAHAIGMTAISFVRERIEATMDRIFAAGVRPAVFIAAHFLTHSLIMFAQTGLLLITSVFIFKIPVEGSIFLVFALLLILGGVGMSIGLVISTAARQETDAVQIALAAFFPALLLSGVLWPLEAVPRWFSWISYSLPTTWAANAMRSIMIRGWGIQHREVWAGFLVPAAWLFFFLLASIWLLKSRDKQSFWRRRKAKKSEELK